MQSELHVLKKFVYDQWSFEFSNLKEQLESAEYGACSFELNAKKIQYRVSKITPTKTGQFVTIWKRNSEGITEPFSNSDDLDFIIITSKSGDNFGQFIFPKSVLANQGIISSKFKVGKRGIRVYPPWDQVTNKEAQKNQSWQTKYFFTITMDKANELDLLLELFR